MNRSTFSKPNIKKDIIVSNYLCLLEQSKMLTANYYKLLLKDLSKAKIKASIAKIKAKFQVKFKKWFKYRQKVDKIVKKRVTAAVAEALNSEKTR